MPVYFIQCQITKNVKIGYTAKNIKSRLSGLQTSASSKLILAKYFEQFDRIEEKLLHKYFRSFRLQGEWFSFEVLNDSLPDILSQNLERLNLSKSSTIQSDLISEITIQTKSLIKEFSEETDRIKDIEVNQIDSSNRRFPEARVRSVIEFRYGKRIDNSTWWNWKCIVEIPKRIRFFTELEVKCLLVLVELKLIKPRGGYLLDNLVEKSKNLDNEEFSQLFIQTKDDLGSCFGRDLPTVIKYQVGREIDVSTLYYWAKKNKKLKFSVNKLYTRQQVDQWIAIAKENFLPLC